MYAIDLEKVVPQGGKKLNRLPGINSDYFAFYLNDTLHLDS